MDLNQTQADEDGKDGGAARRSAETVVTAIRMWREAQKLAADKVAEAETVEARAILAASADEKLRNDAARKASATVASAEAYRLAEHAKADARAAGAVVELLLGARIQ